VITVYKQERVAIVFLAKASLNNMEYKKVDYLKTADDSSI
jgi:hypothetical protein